MKNTTHKAPQAAGTTPGIDTKQQGGKVRRRPGRPRKITPAADEKPMTAKQIEKALQSLEITEDEIKAALAASRKETAQAIESLDFKIDELKKEKPKLPEMILTDKDIKKVRRQRQKPKLPEIRLTKQDLKELQAQPRIGRLPFTEA